MPVMSAVDSVPGLIMGSGFFYGLTMGAGAGQVLADLAMGRKPEIDIRNYRYSRFTDGGKLGYYA